MIISKSGNQKIEVKPTSVGALIKVHAGGRGQQSIHIFQECLSGVIRLLGVCASDDGPPKRVDVTCANCGKAIGLTYLFSWEFPPLAFCSNDCDNANSTRLAQGGMEIVRRMIREAGE